MNRASRPLSEFFASEQASSIILILFTAVSIAMASISWGGTYLLFWHTKIGLRVPGLVNSCKIGILAGSICAGLTGLLILGATRRTAARP